MKIQLLFLVSMIACGIIRGEEIGSPAPMPPHKFGLGLSAGIPPVASLDFLYMARRNLVYRITYTSETYLYIKGMRSWRVQRAVQPFISLGLGFLWPHVQDETWTFRDTVYNSRMGFPPDTSFSQNFKELSLGAGLSIEPGITLVLGRHFNLALSLPYSLVIGGESHWDAPGNSGPISPRSGMPDITLMQRFGMAGLSLSYWF